MTPTGHALPEGETTCDTNLHVHGLHVSPSDNSDNIFLRVPAGESFQYEYQIPPDHPAGLNWYHPHLHGTVTNQVFAGLAGPIIVEGDLDALPGIAGVPERLLVLQATQLYPDGGSVQSITDVPGPPTDGPVMQKKYSRLVNGQLNPTMRIRPGETQRWRILNASPNVTYLLHLDGHQLHQIGKDGNPLNETWTREAIPLSPGRAGRGAGPGGPGGNLRIPHASHRHGDQHDEGPNPGDAGGGRQPRHAATVADDTAAAGGPLDRRHRPAPPDQLPVLRRRSVPTRPSSGSTTRCSAATAKIRSSGSTRPRSG